MKIILILFAMLLGLGGIDAQPAKVVQKGTTPIIQNALIVPYTQPQYEYESDSLRMNVYSFGTSSYNIMKSLDGKHWNNSSVINGEIESSARWTDSPIIWYELIHKYNKANKQYFYKIGFSEDNGITWVETRDTLDDGSKWFGEDHSVTFFPDSSLYYLFVRPQSTSWVQFRKISLIKTQNYTSFSPRKLVIPQDTSNFLNPNSKDYLKSFYSGTMFSTGTNEYWFLCNIYKLDAGLLGTVQNINDTVGNDNCVWSELYYSSDGDTWKKTNDSNAFIPLNNGKRQIFTTPVVIGDTLFIYSFESVNPHLDVNPAPLDWNIYRYKISLMQLRKFYKPKYLLPFRK